MPAPHVSLFLPCSMRKITVPKQEPLSCETPVDLGEYFVVFQAGGWSADDVVFVCFVPKHSSQNPVYEAGWTLNEWADSGRARARNCHPALFVGVTAASSAADDTDVIDYLGNAGSAPHHQLSPSIMWNLAIPHMTPLSLPLNTDLPLCAVCKAHQLLIPLSITSSHSWCHIQKLFYIFPTFLNPRQGPHSSHTRNRNMIFMA